MSWTTILDFLSSYNFYTYKFLIYDCTCYNQYRDVERFKELIKSKKSYFACCITKQGSIIHEKFPIMIGSLIDRVIRQDEILKNKKQFGAFLIRGEFVIMPHFMTNNTNGIHTRKRSDSRVASYSFANHIDENITYTIKFKPENEETSYKKTKT